MNQKTLDYTFVGVQVIHEDDIRIGVLLINRRTENDPRYGYTQKLVYYSDKHFVRIKERFE
jgi:hypothetical protein